jgi:predicted acetyltransferase
MIGADEMTITQTTALLTAVAEMVAQHGAIGVVIETSYFDEVKIRVHIFDRDKFDLIPGEIEEHCIQQTGTYEISKKNDGITFFYLTKENELQQGITS